MPELFAYLLKVNVALVLFYLAYRFALRRLTFYTLNRWFLLFAIIFSSVYPLIDVSAFLMQHEQWSNGLTVVIPDWQVSTIQHQNLGQTVDYWALLVAAYWAGVGLMGLRLLVQLLSLYGVHRSSRLSDLDGYAFRQITSRVNPFSFWQTIYLNPGQHRQEELKAILQHEQVHVSEWHTLDVLLAQLSVVFYWFNPGVWLLKLAIQENLEFITDRRILQSGIDSKAYQYSLIRISNLLQSSALVNNFNFLTIKKRIVMMNKKQSPTAHVARYVVLIPLVVASALLFTACEENLDEQPLSNAVTEVTLTPPDVQAQSADSVTYYIDGKKIKNYNLKNLAPEDIERIDVLKGENARKVFGDYEGKGVIAITTKQNRSAEAVKALNEKITSALSSNNAVKIDGAVDIKQNKSAKDVQVSGIQGSGKVIGITVTGKPKARVMPLQGVPKDALYLLDDEEISYKEVQNIKPEDIKSVVVLKEGEQLQQYGEKGKNGIIMIYTKEQ